MAGEGARASKSAEEQRAIGFLQNDPQMRQAFFNKVSGPIVNKMFDVRHDSVTFEARPHG